MGASVLTHCGSVQYSTASDALGFEKQRDSMSHGRVLIVRFVISVLIVNVHISCKNRVEQATRYTLVAVH
jgi:hypothetical protein